MDKVQHYIEYVSDEEYPDLLFEYQTELNMLQRFLLGEKIPTMIIIEGLETAGKGKVIEEITRSLDPRKFKVFPVFMATEEEQQYPFLYRFWMSTPPRGKIHIFNRSWYVRLLDARIRKRVSKEEWYNALKEVREFERTLIDNGTRIVKIWMQISKKEQKRRLKKRASRPDLRFRVSKNVWKDHKKYEKFQKLLREIIMHTDTTRSPWHIIPADHKKSARVEILKTINDRMVALVGQEFRDHAREARLEILQMQEAKLHNHGGTSDTLSN